MTKEQIAEAEQKAAEEPAPTLFQSKARLEVSGILAGTAPKVTTRVKRKQKQTKQSAALNIPAHVIVVEFGQPLAHHTVRK